VDGIRDRPLAPPGGARGAHGRKQQGKQVSKKDGEQQEHAAAFDRAKRHRPGDLIVGNRLVP